jgi:hypothetical protein
VKFLSVNLELLTVVGLTLSSHDEREAMFNGATKTGAGGIPSVGGASGPSPPRRSRTLYSVAVEFVREEGELPNVVVGKA